MEKDYERVRKILEEQFQAALKQREMASANFNQVTHEIPSGLPQPDGTERIANASTEYSTALRAVTRAVQRIADFQIRGIVPDDLANGVPKKT